MRQEFLWLIFAALFIWQPVLLMSAFCAAAKLESKSTVRLHCELNADDYRGPPAPDSNHLEQKRAVGRPAAAEVKAPNEVESGSQHQRQHQQQLTVYKSNEGKDNADDNVLYDTLNATKKPCNDIANNLMSSKQRHNSFGSSDDQLQFQFQLQLQGRLQDYSLLYNAERHTYFQLHTNQPMDAGRALQHFVGDTLSAALGLNRLEQTPPVRVESVQLYDAASLRSTQYNPFNPTRILIHGWLGNAHANVYSALLPAYLSLGNVSYNVFTVDWGRGALADYITASYRVKPVGQVVAKFIDFLHQEAGMRFEDLQLIGFSMGAHIAGLAAKHVQTGHVHIIRALDPALPFFRYAQQRERLARSDADYVEVLHTSVGSYGFDRPLGHVDFYANWGRQQPGCFWLECSHWRAFALFAESLSEARPFVARGCNATWQEIMHQKRCPQTTGRTLNMGGDLANMTSELLAARQGVYYFQTNANAPYAMRAEGDPPGRHGSLLTHSSVKQMVTSSTVL